jgi:transporter family protein
VRPEIAESWLFWALLSALFAAGTAIFAKIGVEQVDSDLATLVRTLIVAAVLTGMLAATGRLQTVSMTPRSWLFLTLSALATGASWLCYFRALKLGDAARVAPVDKLSVVLAAVLGVFVLGEKFLAINWLGVGMIAVGAALVAWR